MARKSRTKKSALNQESKPVDENKVGWVNSEPEQDTKKIIEELEKNHGVDGQEEIDKIFADELQKEVDNAIKEKLPTLEEVEEDIENEEEYKAPQQPIEKPDDFPDKFPVELPEDEEKKEITKEDLMKLSKKGYRYYQRTGKLPQE